MTPKGEPDLNTHMQSYTRYYIKWETESNNENTFKTRIVWYHKIWWKKNDGSGSYIILADEKLDPNHPNPKLAENYRNLLKSLQKYTIFTESTEQVISLHEQSEKYKEKIMQHYIDPDKLIKTLQSNITDTGMYSNSAKPIEFGNEVEQKSVSPTKKMKLGTLNDF